MAYDVQDFSSDVIERSHKLPVLVDFWAPWCAPCRVLGPTLEKLAVEQSGRWELVKVNSDENPQVSMQYGVRGIPAVKLFIDGEVSAEFTGALPEHAVRQWLDQNIPSASSEAVSKARARLEGGDFAGARELLEPYASDPEAAPTLARALVFDEPYRALDVAGSANGASGEDRQVLDAVKEIGSLLTEDGEELPDGPGREPYTDALTALRERRLDDAASELIEVLKHDRYYHEDAARKLGVALYTVLGSAHPVSRKYRRTFDMYLY